MYSTDAFLRLMSLSKQKILTDQCTNFTTSHSTISNQDESMNIVKLICITNTLVSKTTGKKSKAKAIEIRFDMGGWMDGVINNDVTCVLLCAGCLA